MNTEHATPELFAALSEAQGEIENASKNAKNPHFKSQYADLAEILNTVRPIFAKHGLTLTQSPSFDGSLASVTTVIGHKSGGFVTGKASCVPAKSDAQGIGAATTYLRRYSAAGMAGIAQEDDDGNSAAHDRKPEPVQRKQAPATDPIAQKLAAFRADAIRIGKDAGIEADMAWANAHMVNAAKANNLDLKGYAKFTPEQLQSVLEEAHLSITAEIAQNAEVANA